MKRKHAGTSVVRVKKKERTKTGSITSYFPLASFSGT